MARIDIRPKSTERLREAKAGEFRMRLAEPDPWVKVGTTTIDGNMEQVYEVLGVSPWPWLCASDTTGAIDHFMRAEQPWLIGGRHLRGVGSHWDAQADTAVIHCDVVRRQSDLDAERKAHVDFVSAWATDPWRNLGRPAASSACPECGPHGGAGRVLLLESWVDCTTCRPTASTPRRDPDDLSHLAFDQPSRTFKIDPEAKNVVVYFTSGQHKIYPVPVGYNTCLVFDEEETAEFAVRGT